MRKNILLMQSCHQCFRKRTWKMTILVNMIRLALKNNKIVLQQKIIQFNYTQIWNDFSHRINRINYKLVRHKN